MIEIAVSLVAFFALCAMWFALPAGPVTVEVPAPMAEPIATAA